MTPNKPLSQEAARTVLWHKGELSWKLHKAQLDMRDAFNSSDGLKFIINSSRQLGKSVLLCALAIEYALKNPDVQIKYAAPTQRMVKQIIKPHFRMLLKDCPDDIRPEWFAQDSRYVFKNGSQIDIAGAEAGNSDRLRGTRMHLGIVDEAGFCSELSYLVQDVMLPMTLTTNGRIILASTPAKTPMHPFEQYWKQAEEGGNRIRKTIFDNPLISEKKIKQYIRECGGEQTTAWKREYLAEFIIDAESVVVPEFGAVEADIIQDLVRPSYFDAYTSLDPGYRDLTVALFGYWDFQKASLVIEDEFVLNKTRTDILADGIKAKELVLWGKQKPYFRVADNELILIQDLDTLHGLRFIATDKDNKLAQINELRVMVQAKRLLIHPRCRTLISHLKNAVWDNNTKDTFARIEGFGHFDAIDALVYMLRNVRKHHNPFPAEGQPSSDTHWVSRMDTERSPTAKVFERLFPIRKF